MTCGYCAREFEEDRGQPACRSCPLASACRWVRCPYCGYENPTPPAWLERVRAWVEGGETGGGL